MKIETFCQSIVVAASLPNKKPSPLGDGYLIQF